MTIDHAVGRWPVGEGQVAEHLVAHQPVAVGREEMSCAAEAGPGAGNRNDHHAGPWRLRDAPAHVFAAQELNQGEQRDCQHRHRRGGTQPAREEYQAGQREIKQGRGGEPVRRVRRVGLVDRQKPLQCGAFSHSAAPDRN
jgi:hypothetical protein